MRVAHFVQRYPPALGGSEAYFARLSRYLAAAGDEVTVFTTNAARPGGVLVAGAAAVCRAGTTREDGVEVRRYRAAGGCPASAGCSSCCRCAAPRRGKR